MIVEYPLIYFYDRYWPKHLLPISDPSLINKIWLEPIRVSVDDSSISFSTGVHLTESVDFFFSSLENIKLVFGTPGQNAFGKFKIKFNRDAIAEVRVPAYLSINDFLKPVTLQGDSYVASNSPLNITFTGPIFSFNLFTQEFSINPDTEINVPLCMVGDTGVILEVSGLKFENALTSPVIKIEHARVILPSLFTIPNGIEVILDSARIDRNGFSGSCAIDIPLEYNAAEKKFFVGDQELRFMDIAGGLKRIEIKIENNHPTGFTLEGQLLVPFFDEPVDVRFQIDNSLNISATIITPGEGLPIKKDELLGLTIKSGTVALQTDPYFEISGSIEPLLFSNEGLTWPKFDVKNLRLQWMTGQNPPGFKISFDEAWADLKSLATLSLFGFHFELRRIGLGATTDEQLWIDLSGGLRLIEQVPISVDIEGFRLTWPQVLSAPASFTPAALQQFASQIQVKFDGVALQFEVPGALKLDGLIRFFKDSEKVGFAGDLAIDVPPAGFSAEAGLMIGMNTTPPPDGPFPFFYVYFGFEAASGIPLGQSGLALKGAIGLFGINVAPAKSETENWYGDWYKREKTGVQYTTKWRDYKGGLAIGIGVTITSADGFLKGTKGILVLCFPGPVLIIVGKALVLAGINPADPSEPPLTAAAIFDGNNGTVQFNIEAQAELIKDTLEARAELEAFFDFKDLTNWHLYLGQKTPASKRVQANMLDIIRADAYLMLDMVGSSTVRARLGASTTIEPDIPDAGFEIDSPTGTIEIKIKIDVELYMGADGEITINPFQFEADAELDLDVDINVVEVLKVGFSASGDIGISGPNPLNLDKASFEYSLDLPWPLPDYEDSFSVELEKPKKDTISEIASPLNSISLFSRFTSESVSLKIPEADEITNETYEAENSPMVAMDVNPVLSFFKNMNLGSGLAANFLQPASGEYTYKSGESGAEFRPAITTIKIWQHKKSDPWTTGWEEIYSTAASDQKKLYGTFLAEGDIQSPGELSAKRIQLLTLNPLINTTHAPIGDVFRSGSFSPFHPSRELLINYPDIISCPESSVKPEKHCINFVFDKPAALRGKPTIRKDAYEKWVYGEIKLSAEESLIVNPQNDCLEFAGSLLIEFSEAVYAVEIEFCNKIEADIKKQIAFLDCLWKVKRHYSRTKIEPVRVFPRSLRDTTRSKVDTLPKKVLVPWDESKNEVPFTSSVSGSTKLILVINTKDCATALVLKDLKDAGIKMICIVYRKSVEDAKRIKEKCDNNRLLVLRGDPLGKPGGSFGSGTPAPGLFKPGCYYRIEVIVRTQLLQNPGSVYDMPGGISYYEHHHYAYFQTDAPPGALDPYIKWSYPAPLSDRFFANEDLQIRFKRSYLSKIFTADLQDRYKLKAKIKDLGSGDIIPVTNLQWKKAGSYTFFPDEESWSEHRNGTPFNDFKDDVLLLKNPGLQINKRYALILLGADGGASLVKPGRDGQNVVKDWPVTGDTGWITIEQDHKIFGIQNMQASKKALTGMEDWDDYTILFDIIRSNLSRLSIILRYRLITADTGAVEAYYSVSFDLSSGNLKLMLSGHYGTIKEQFAEASSIPITSATLLNIKCTMVGSSIEVFVADTKFDLCPAVNSPIKAWHQLKGQSTEQLKYPFQSGRVGFIFAQANNAELRNIYIRKPELLKLPFTTGKMQSFANHLQWPLSGTTEAPKNIIPIIDAPNLLPINTELTTQFSEMNDAAFELYKKEKDMEYGMALTEIDNKIFTGKDAVEQERIKYRTAAAFVDSGLSDMLSALDTDFYFAELENPYAIKALKKNGKLAGLWIRSKGDFDIQIRQDLTSGSNFRLGNLLIKEIRFNNNLLSLSPILFNSDKSQILVLFNNGPSINLSSTSNQRKLTIQFGDWANIDDFYVRPDWNKAHRYDRVKKSVTADDMNVEFVLAGV